MDSEQQPPQYGLGIDASSKEFLTEAARWASFLSIVGFAVCGIIIMTGLFAPAVFSPMLGRMNEGQLQGISPESLASAISIFYIGAAILYFFPCLHLYRFSVRMKKALATVDQESLISSFQSLKNMFRFVGILTLIMVCLSLINILGMIAGRLG
jgi:uncharacterized membrane protein